MKNKLLEESMLCVNLPTTKTDPLELNAIIVNFYVMHKVMEDNKMKCLIIKIKLSFYFLTILCYLFLSSL